MLISFEKLIRKCIHEDKKNKFHNRIDINKLRQVFTQIHDKLKEINNKSLEQILEKAKPGEKREFKPLQGGRLKKLVNYFSSLSNSREIERLILNNPVWQLRVNEEMRIIGILEKNYIDGKFLANDKKHNKDLFYILYYDFHHTSFSNPNKEKPKEEDLICIMNEKCPSYPFLP